jgi:hypothetical protein
MVGILKMTMVIHTDETYQHPCTKNALSEKVRSPQAGEIVFSDKKTHSPSATT